jgi:hypothetical protein
MQITAQFDSKNPTDLAELQALLDQLGAGETGGGMSRAEVESGALRSRQSTISGAASEKLVANW